MTPRRCRRYAGRYRATKITEPEFGRVVKGIDPTAASQSADVDSLEAQLDLVARCVKAAVPTRVYMVSLGGFDTHADERGTQEDLLKKVDQALTPFLRADAHQFVRQAARRDDVFGVRSPCRRQCLPGHRPRSAGPVFLAGAPVKGGFYGDEPSLPTSTTGT